VEAVGREAEREKKDYATRDFSVLRTVRKQRKNLARPLANAQICNTQTQAD